MTDETEAIHKYADIIHLPHHISKRHPQMPVANRAAQFAPFAALTGYEEAVRETARLTEEKAELDENSKRILDEKLSLLTRHMDTRPEVTITYFQADEKKSGGSYRTISAPIKRVDEYHHLLCMQDHTKINLDDIVDIECELFDEII